MANEETDLSNDEELHAEFAINVSDVMERITGIEQDMGATAGTTEVLIRADTTVERQEVSDTREEALAVEPGGDTYGVNPARSKCVKR